MKIEIDLNDVFCGDEGEESLEASIRRQVLDRLTYDYKERLFKNFDSMLMGKIEEAMQEAVVSRMPELVESVMTEEYTPVDRWGQRGATTTFRTELVKKVADQMEYKPLPDYQRSHENVFTRTVRAAIDERCKEVQKKIKEVVDSEIEEQALKVAMKALEQKFNLKK